MEIFMLFLSIWGFLALLYVFGYVAMLFVLALAKIRAMCLIKWGKKPLTRENYLDEI